MTTGPKSRWHLKSKEGCECNILGFGTGRQDLRRGELQTMKSVLKRCGGATKATSQEEGGQGHCLSHTPEEWGSEPLPASG